MLSSNDEVINYLKTILLTDSDSQVSILLGLQRSNTSKWRRGGLIESWVIQKAEEIAMKRYEAVVDVFGSRLSGIAPDIPTVAQAISAGAIMKRAFETDADMENMIKKIKVTSTDLATLYGVKRLTIDQAVSRNAPISKQYPIAKIGLAVHRIVQAKRNCNGCSKKEK